MRNYEYGARAPIQNAALCAEQLRLAQCFYREAAQIEIRRRAVVDSIYRSANPDAWTTYTEAEQRVTAAVEELRRARSYQTVKAELKDEEAATAVREARDALVAQREAARTARLAWYAARKATTPKVRLRLRWCDRGAYQRQKQLYNRYPELAWGTRLKLAESIERAAKAAQRDGNVIFLPPPPPASVTPELDPQGVPYPRSYLDGTIAVQLQGGLSWKDAIEGGDTRFRLEIVDLSTWLARQGRATPTRPDGTPMLPQAGSRRSEKCRHAFAWLRVASDESRGPIWGVFPVRLHREIPSKATIKWASICVRHVGTRTHLSLLLTIDDEGCWPTPRPVQHTLAVNLGWRRRFNEAGEETGIRVAYVVGTDGFSQEICVPPDYLRRVAHVESLSSLRGKLAAQALGALRAWIDNPDRTATLPEWFTSATEYIHLWNGEKRVLRLLRQWERNRFDGDEAIFAALALWRNGKRPNGHSTGNHHLRFWEFDEREKALRYRRDVYRNLAAAWANRYERIVVTDMDLRDFAEESKAEDGPRDRGAPQRRARTLAAPSILRAAILNAASTRGVTVLERAGAFTTTCAACGVVEDFNRKRDLLKTCSACGTAADQDANHARALLAALAAEAAAEAAAAAPAASTVAGSELKGRWVRRRAKKIA